MPAASPPNVPPVRVRPRAIRIVACAVAVVIAAAFVASSNTLTDEAAFAGRLIDRAGWPQAASGLLLAAVVAVAPFRIAADADADGIHVRNLVREFTVPWSMVRAVRYHRGAPWASLQLTTEEVVTVLAVQIADGQRAVEAIRGLRALHAAAQQRSGDPDNGAAEPAE
ncbi:PH domain-containing protein [Spirilliplanes yamanashiensis]|uniref:Low molecular weight protein antigen 6 PH domain-containing protein n=1 Tax=Spirilliplanes yamanashiensis TaxID=42233 RepID=A0A8J3YEH1_9ACTN|nr:PH domain-containing protein [Spirilliplanes yamanashiensis]MDP9818369.1 hypothetical protein [Spirilliplanes yamanashiensis]GIJ06589.1 hypothetical protein Sya03_59410 [Spirilliplanes yamanashiensis]